MYEEREFDIIFGEGYTHEEEKIIVNEIKNAIKYVFKKNEMSYVGAIKVVKEYTRGDSSILNGEYNIKDNSITICTKRTADLKNINKLKNIICHELVHLKFSWEIINYPDFIPKMNGDIPMYYINEFIACKISNNYSYVTSDLKKYIRKNINEFYEKDRVDSNINIQKDLASEISMYIIAEEILKKAGKNIPKIKEKYILKIANILKNIKFIPTELEYKNIRDELISQGFNII